ncbi:MAG: hypothetical protein GVY19_12280 [Bacteroidetes bacterium]|jgi:rhamnulokinase|nr:hypothetical protein [Bacteroidota bacterium]
MTDLHCLAIDMGASSIRLVLGKINEQGIVYEEIYRFKNDVETIDNADKWNIQKIYDQILSGITLALEHYPAVSSVGIDTWGVDYVLLDEHHGLIETPFAYRDQRTEGMMEQWKQFMSPEETFHRTGINFYQFNTLFQLLASKGEESLKKAKYLLFLSGYIYFRLTGEKVNELTISSTSQMLQVHSRQFDTAITDQLGLSTSLFCKVVDPGQVIGPVNEPRLPENHLNAVTVCCHDTASAVAAIPATSEEFIFIATGTWCILGIESMQPILSNEALNAGFTNERGFNNSYRILKNIVGLWLIQGIQKALDKKIEFEEMDQIARETANTGLLINPDDPLFYNPENMIGAFNEYFRKTNQPVPTSSADYIKCAYDSLSLSFVYYLKKIESIAQKELPHLHLIGGGIQAEYFCQCIADFTDKEVIAGPVESAALGNIMVQGIAMKKIKHIQEGRKLLARSCEVKRYRADQEQSVITKMYNQFIQLKEQ